MYWRHMHFILTADQVLHERRCCQSFVSWDESSRGMRATRITVSCTTSIFFGWVGQRWFRTIPSVVIIPSSDAVSSTTFQVAVFLRQHCLLQWFSRYHYKRYFNNFKIQLCSRIYNNKLCYQEEHSTSVVHSWCTLWQKICWWLINHFYVICHESYRIRRNETK